MSGMEKESQVEDLGYKAPGLSFLTDKKEIP